MILHESFTFILLGLIIGILASFTGLGGGFLMVPLLLFLGFEAQKAVGTSFMGILIISISALFAHGKLENVDYRVGILLGIGGIIGAQMGARLLDMCLRIRLRKYLPLFSFCWPYGCS